MVNFPLFTGFYTSKVVQEFFHQQYVDTPVEGFIQGSHSRVLYVLPFRRNEGNGPVDGSEIPNNRRLDGATTL